MPGRRRPRDEKTCASGGSYVARERSPRGNPPGLTSRGFLPRGKRREAVCDPQMGGLPKCAKIWPGGDWHGETSPGKTQGSPRGNGLPK